MVVADIVEVTSNMDRMKRVPVAEQEAKVRAKNFEEVCLGYTKEDDGRLSFLAGKFTRKSILIQWWRLIKSFMS